MEMEEKTNRNQIDILYIKKFQRHDPKDARLTIDSKGRLMHAKCFYIERVG